MRDYSNATAFLYSQRHTYDSTQLGFDPMSAFWNIRRAANKFSIFLPEVRWISAFVIEVVLKSQSMIRDSLSNKERFI